MSKEKNIQGNDKKEYLSTANVPPDSDREADNKQEPSRQSQPATSNQQPAFAKASADKPATEDMEVHKHPHHVTHKKKWSEYFLEFFMIFFAVTMGFFAENIREKIAEQKHEKQYAKLLLEDLRADTAAYRKTKQKIERQQPDFDSLFKRLTRTPPVSNKKVLEKLLPLGYTYKMRPTTTTYNEMKSSGTLRYIENQKLLRDIQTYYEINVPSSQEFADMMNDYFNQHIVPFYINQVRVQDYSFKTDSLTTNDPIIVDRTPKLDQQLANVMYSYGNLLDAYVRTRLTVSEDKAKKIIASIEEDYHF